jgi:hypothetical protein
MPNELHGQAYYDYLKSLSKAELIAEFKKEKVIFENTKGEFIQKLVNLFGEGSLE